MTTRKIVGALLSLIVLFFVPVMTQAETVWEELPEEADVEPDKTWTIEFNTPINQATLQENIYVKTLDDGKYIPTYDVSEDGKKVVVHPPEDGYVSSGYYKLVVENDISSDKGKQMDQGYEKNFSIKSYEKPVIEEKPVLSTGTVTADVLNVRAEPNASSKKLGSLSRGDVVDVYDFEDFWTEIEFNGQKAYVHKTYMKLRKAGGTAVEGQRIVIDAGHGDHDPGAQSWGAQEKEINLDVSLRVAERLKALGATPILTRDTDQFLTLQGRVEYAQEVRGDLFVSIHANAASPGAKGSEVFYDSRKLSNVEEGRALAGYIQRKLVDIAGMYDRGVKDNNFYVIHYNTLPSVLVELGFMTNSGDFEKLTSNYYRDLYAQAITEGIVDYYEAEVN
ncbi:N-acetylmuramoyl-L-alanine amidase [Pontibacillus chungwhensis BH030062]|uniref:N-acetylmuramoyl-L-alanine amidase n=1 Tax=Pontibacillus chungwhensis BH030062 TaxID=1385513 RepID=A0A0A2UT05_9BACI|nr:N-acetylmuramoyl-L-alanine amidase [Pontibacillus chungwhensis]KGP91417.1 N-acetylmuramoyl-L-alanine amidase [Pontibacillus chungwhensis BH030062]